MSLKEQLEIDTAVYFNPDEFGELHQIDGENIHCIINQVSSANWSDGTQQTQFDAVVTTVSVEIIVAAAGLSSSWIAGSLVTVDNQEWEITEVKNVAGIIAATLTRNC